MTRVVLHTLLLMLLLLCGGASAQEVLRIAAVVNDDVISVQDLRERLTLAMASANLEDRPEMRRRLAPQVLRRLIDEKLQLQEAKRLNIAVTKRDIDDAIARIEQRNNLSRGGLNGFLARKGIRMSVFLDQIEAEIAWAKVIDRVVRPRINVGQDEVAEMLAKVRAGTGKPEYRVAEIFLPVDNPELEGETRELAERLIQQLKEGATFAALAEGFSQSASAAVGGELGWIRPGQLAEEFDTALSGMQPGQISSPIRTVAGYHIINLIDRRISAGLAQDTGGVVDDVTLALHQLFLPLPQGAAESEVTGQTTLAGTLAETAANCADMERLGKELGSPMSGRLNSVKLGQLPPQLRAVVESLPDEKASQPIRVDNGILVLMVCERQAAKDEKPTAESESARITNALMIERLDVAIRQYLRDLRRRAFVDVRV